jgi:hypothetical protein
MVEYFFSLQDSTLMRDADSSQSKRESNLFLKRTEQYGSFIERNDTQSTDSSGIVEIAMKEEIILDQNISSISVLSDKLLSIEGGYSLLLNSK